MVALGDHPAAGANGGHRASQARSQQVLPAKTTGAMAGGGTRAVLVHPPVAKPSEPPAGLLKLGGVLAAHHLRYTLLDANLEGLLHLITTAAASPSDISDRWSRRAYRNAPGNIDFLKSREGYRNMERYRRAVVDLNRVLQKSASSHVRLSLADYIHPCLSPVKSTDLLRAAERPDENIFYSYFSSRLSSVVEEAGSKALVGFSINYLSQALTAFAMIGYVRKRHPASKIIVGGGLVTSWMRNPSWKNPFGGLVDEVVAGPGEDRLLTLLGVKTDGGKFSPCPDTLPLDQYMAPGLILPYAASTGCYWGRCSFCPEKAEGTPFRQNAKGRVVDDLIDLSARYRPAILHLVDNAVSPAVMAALSEKPPGVPWYGFARVTAELADSDFCRQLRRSGCVMLKLGLESGDQDVLDAMNKGVDLQTASRVLKALKGQHISTYVYLLFGTPQETCPAAEKTLDFVLLHRQYIDYLNLAIFNMSVNCAEANGFETRSFYEGDLSLYTDFIHPKGWNRRDVRSFLNMKFKSHPGVRPILQRRPPFFTSNHAPLFASLWG